MTQRESDKGCVTFCSPAKPCYKCRYNQAVAEAAVRGEALEALLAGLSQRSVDTDEIQDRVDAGERALGIGLAARAKAVMEVLRAACRHYDARDLLGDDLDEAVALRSLDDAVTSYRALACTPPVFGHATKTADAAVREELGDG